MDKTLIFCYGRKRMNGIKNKKSKLNKKWVIGLAVLLAIVAGAAVYAYSYSNSNNTSDKPAKHKSSGSPQPDSSKDVNLNPPTNQDKTDAEKHKDEIANPPATSAPPSSQPKKVTPIITSWGQSNGNVEVAARVPGIFENGGNCTLTLQKGSQKVTGSKTGKENVSEVSCGFIPIARSSLSAGDWVATVNYSSAKAEGASQPKTITVK